MYTKERPAPCREGTGRKCKQQIFNRPIHITTIPKISKQKLHPSRQLEQRELDRALLALFGLEFKPVARMSFHQLDGIGGHYG